MSPPLVLSCQQAKISQVIYASTKVLRSLCFYSLNMSGFIPKILIFGHSFVRRLNDDLYSGFDKRARINFHMASSGDVSLKGIGGRTVDKVFAHDIEWLKGSKPDILILELGTNDLSCLPHEVVGSRIHDLACFMWVCVRS